MKCGTSAPNMRVTRQSTLSSWFTQALLGMVRFNQFTTPLSFKYLPAKGNLGLVRSSFVIEGMKSNIFYGSYV